ncbi:DUF2956 domain-containing protein [Ferrimonas gelatinilytica]|uniref:DUF2956 domain-containing protein n=1 Tax=Ferrimonas gelatinilytica TaxID=1255257 RepID=A0ABP9RUX2_9GAMM
MAKPSQTYSPEVVAEAMKIAKATQKPGQTKEQTKLIAKGIEKGIFEYKKQQKARARAADRAKKQEQKAKARTVEAEETAPTQKARTENRNTPPLPWILLALSWLGFISYLVLQAG